MDKDTGVCAELYSYLYEETEREGEKEELI